MAKTANLNIPIDPQTKEAAKKLFSNFGITLTDAVNMFLHQSLITGGLPFQVQLLQPNAQTVSAIKGVENMIDGRTPSSLQSVDDFFKKMKLHEDR